MKNEANEMISINELLKYYPRKHGEHGVDSTLHMLAAKQKIVHEVFINPPGASWSQADIIRPRRNEIYRWDHMPRVTEAKRPNWVLQFNEDNKMNFLLVESKQSINDLYENMGKTLIQFFISSKSSLGLRYRPAWHRKKIDDPIWTFISPEDDDEIRFWFKKYDDKNIFFWPGFAFALTPEYYQTNDKIKREEIRSKCSDILKSRKDLKIVIGVGWSGPHHFPFAIADYSDDFKDTSFALKLAKLLEPILSQ
jgi:hypothetical protein